VFQTGDVPRDHPTETPWWESPALAYSKGLADGSKIGYEQATRAFMDALLAGITTGSDLYTASLKEAIARQIRKIETDAYRAAWDATAALPRPSDYQGDPNYQHQRRAA
jgi:hypothetical protein